MLFMIPVFVNSLVFGLLFFYKDTLEVKIKGKYQTLVAFVIYCLLGVCGWFVCAFCNTGC